MTLMSVMCVKKISNKFLAWESLYNSTLSHHEIPVLPSAWFFTHMTQQILSLGMAKKTDRPIRDGWNSKMEFHIVVRTKRSQFNPAYKTSFLVLSDIMLSYFCRWNDLFCQKGGWSGGINTHQKYSKSRLTQGAGLTRQMMSTTWQTKTPLMST